MKAGNRTPGARLRIVARTDVAIGPGRADILEGIGEAGSIAAAARRMAMSYKRAWHLVAAMNAAFGAPLVETARGGRAGGHATLTPLGAEVLARYRRMEALTESAIATEIAALERILPPER